MVPVLRGKKPPYRWRCGGVMRSVRVKEIRSGSMSAACAARVLRALRAWWTSSQAQISWWTSSGNRERRIRPGPRRTG